MKEISHIRKIRLANLNQSITFILYSMNYRQQNVQMKLIRDVADVELLTHYLNNRNQQIILRRMLSEWTVKVIASLIFSPSQIGLKLQNFPQMKASGRAYEYIIFGILVEVVLQRRVDSLFTLKWFYVCTELVSYSYLNFVLISEATKYS